MTNAIILHYSVQMQLNKTKGYGHYIHGSHGQTRKFQIVLMPLRLRLRMLLFSIVDHALWVELSFLLKKAIGRSLPNLSVWLKAPATEYSLASENMLNGNDQSIMWRGWLIAALRRSFNVSSERLLFSFFPHNSIGFAFSCQIG